MLGAQAEMIAMWISAIVAMKRFAPDPAVELLAQVFK